MYWEEQTVNSFYNSIEKTGGVCLFPIGCIEKHGNHLPLGTDVYTSREIASRAWYAEHPWHFAGDPTGASAEYGEDLLNFQAQNLAEVIKYIKNDKMIPDLFEEFYSQHKNPQI